MKFELATIISCSPNGCRVVVFPRITVRLSGSDQA